MVDALINIWRQTNIQSNHTIYAPFLQVSPILSSIYVAIVVFDGLFIVYILLLLYNSNHMQKHQLKQRQMKNKDKTYILLELWTALNKQLMERVATKLRCILLLSVTTIIYVVVFDVKQS